MCHRSEEFKAESIWSPHHSSQEECTPLSPSPEVPMRTFWEGEGNRMVTLEVDTWVSVPDQHCPALWCRESYRTSTCLSVFVYKMEAILVTIPRVFQGLDALIWMIPEPMLNRVSCYSYKWMALLSLPACLSLGENWTGILHVSLSFLAVWPGTSYFACLNFGFLLC